MTAIASDAARGAVEVTIVYDDAGDIETLLGGVMARDLRPLRGTAATGRAAASASFSVPALVERLLAWSQAEGAARTLRGEPDTEQGVIALHVEPSAGAARLLIPSVSGDMDVIPLDRPREEIESAIDRLVELARGTDAKDVDDARRYLWKPFDGIMQHLASYVSPPALRALRLNDGVAEMPEATSDPLEARNRAARLYDNLRRARIEYATEPWTGLTRQQVRHPWWLIEDRWGTCLDLAVAYAAMCLQARVPALLAVPPGHALVLVDATRALPTTGSVEPWKRDWAQAMDDTGMQPVDSELARTGVAAVRGAGDIAALEAELDAGDLLAVDVVAVTHAEGFEAALERGRAALASGATFVDVPYLHTRKGLRPLPDPEERRRRPIRTYPQAAPPAVQLHSNQQRALEALQEASGIVVLLGPAGQGKSTVARRLQVDAPFGEGWFLNASEPQTLISSLADADQAEDNRTAAGLAAADRRGWYERALRRLAEAPGRWIAVFDNADGDPGKVMPLLPHAGPNQLVLVTSTNSDWERVADRVERLPPLDDDTVATVLDAALVPLVGGRALLLEAFRALTKTTGVRATDIPGHAPPEDRVSGPARGPATFWAALRAALDLDREAMRFCLQCAYLPPDHQPLAALQALNSDASQLARRLSHAGLLSFDEHAEKVAMHRLFGAAVRADLQANQHDLDEDVVLELPTLRPAVFDALDRYGDEETLMRIDDSLTAIDAQRDGADPGLGAALHAVAELLELGGHTRRSGDSYARAERHLRDAPELLADVLHARARTVNQHRAADAEALRQALSWAEEAEQILLATPRGKNRADRCLAMQGLLKQRLSRFPNEGETQVELLHRARETIEEAHRRRVEGLDPLDPELARSEFNLAGVRIQLAQVEPGRAREHLDAAERVYKSVGDRRRRIYDREVHPHIAACIIGEAYVNYYRALLVPAPPATRTAWLRAATERADTALAQRQALDGSLDLDESRKAARFLAKVALARSGTAQAVESVSAEVLRELAVAAVETLPSRARDLSGAISAWAFSPALADVVRAFDGTPPTPDTPLGEALEWLEDFSLRWDYRRGEERNLVAPEDLGPDVEERVLRAAAALGLVGTSPPSRMHYDHVLVLGGLVRACMARPLYAAKLLSDGEMTAGAVTALGGFRELKGDEIELAMRLEQEGLSDEFAAMDAGVRRAFALGQPVSERGEHSDLVGESWAVREYHSDGMPVRVVGAPSTKPGERRANTEDTYRWFASQLVHLHGGETLLIVTSDIYVPYQHADALRMLALPYSVEVDAIGVSPGDADPALAQTFRPHNYLQEIRSTIRALRMLYRARPEL